MITAKEARETAILAQQEKVLVERKRESDHRAEVTQKVDAQIEQKTVELDKLITEAISAGDRSARYVVRDSEVERILIGRLITHYVKFDYQTQRTLQTVDMGDSSAPCLIEQLVLTVSW